MESYSGVGQNRGKKCGKEEDKGSNHKIRTGK